MRTFIRWAGSKRLILHRLRQFWPGGQTRYVEPFAGSACLFFDLEPKSAILGDLNGDLINAMRCIKRDVDRVLGHLFSFRRGALAYSHIRALDPVPLTDYERAARFLYLNRYCFNGLYRTNMRGQFNVPYGPPKKGESLARVDESLVRSASKMLANALLLHCDFAHTLSQCEAGDFVYLDPPYAVGSRRVFAEYLPDSFGNGDLPRLAAALHELHQRRVAFVITYADCAESRALLREWRPVRIRTPRNIAGFVGSRKFSYELLATNLELDRHGY